MQSLNDTQTLIHKLAQRVFDCVGPGHSEQIYQKAWRMNLLSTDIKLIWSII